MPDPLLPPAPDPWAVKVHAQATAAAPGEVPAYGSEAFHALPETSPLRVAAAVEAAEAWRTYWTPAEHAHRLAVELAAGRADQATGAHRLADAIGWAAGGPGRVQALIASASAASRRTAVRPPAEPMPEPRPLVQDPAWPSLVAPPGAVVVPAAEVAAVAGQLRREHAGPRVTRRRMTRREETAAAR